MSRIRILAVAAGLAIAASAVPAANNQELREWGFISGWKIFVDPSYGNGCLIQTIYEDLSVVRIGFDARDRRGYFAVFNKNWGEIESGQTYPVTFNLDGKVYEHTATGFYLGKVPGAALYFEDREFLFDIARKKGMTISGQNGTVMKIDLSGTLDALQAARDCQNEQS